MSLPSCCAVLPVLDGLPFLRRSLPPLIALVGQDLTEVVVVDDGCADGSAAYARALGARVLATEGRTGPAAARNLGVASCQAEVVFFVDADVVVHRDAVRRLRERLADPELVAVFGSYDDRPPDAGFFSRWKNLQHHFVHTRAPGDAGTFWTGCGAVRREAFSAVGGFDVARFPVPSVEDIDLGYRLRSAGGRIALDPTVRATHLKTWGFVDLVRTDVLRRALPWSRMLLSREEPRDELNLAKGERARAGLAALVGLTALSTMAPIVGLLLAPAAALSLGLAAMANARLMALFMRRHGLLFASGGLVFLQVYYLYAAGAYLVAWAEARVATNQSERPGA
ncbi:MAG: glycosyltransferase [Deltaproteobacteria bacterium]|nr:glycosyltransferase [Deltaproteobacteria bacterium]